MDEQQYDGVTYDAMPEDADAGADASREMATVTQTGAVATSAPRDFSREQLDLIKKTVAAGTSDVEFALFIEVCRLTGLNPFAHQIYAIMRNAREQDGQGAWRDVKRMTIQTGIDGYLAIAHRTDEFAGMDDVQFDTEEGEHPTWARVTVYRFVKGQRVPFTATARWREYVQTNSKGAPTAMWASKGWTMLGKCARALALRIAFPSELGGVYTADEMAQADNPVAPVFTPTPATTTTPTAADAEPQAQRTRTAKRQAAPHTAPQAATVVAELPMWSELSNQARTLGLSVDEWQQTITAVTGKARQTDPQTGEVITLSAQLTEADKRAMMDWLKQRRALIETDAATPDLSTLAFAGN